MPETGVQFMCRVLREAMPAERLKAEIEFMESGVAKFDQWMSEMPVDERQRLIARVLAEESR